LKSAIRGKAYSNDSKGQQLQKPLSKKFVDGGLELLEALRCPAVKRAYSMLKSWRSYLKGEKRSQ